MVLYYSDIRISGFGFFRIFSLYDHNVESGLMKFGMNDPQGGTEDLHFPDIRMSGHPTLDFFSDIFNLRPQF